MSLPISGFTAVPNPQMLSYMMSQSWIMMYAAGGAWQYGKRRISAMSNEEFNKLLPIDLLKEHTVMLREAIPTIQQSIQDMTPLINTLMTQFGTFINEAIKAIPQAVTNILGTPGGEFSNIPTTGGTGGALPPQMASFLHYFKTVSQATKVKPSEVFLGQEEQTHAQRVEIQRLQTIKNQNLAKALEVQRLRQIVKTAQQGKAIAPFQGNKPRAGQSQIMERKRLIGFIQSTTRNLNLAKSWRAGGQRDKVVAFHIKALKEHRQKLVNLLDRYRF